MQSCSSYIASYIRMSIDLGSIVYYTLAVTVLYVDKMSLREARTQKDYSLDKASDDVYEEVDIVARYGSTLKKKETGFVDPAHYAAIAEGHLPNVWAYQVGVIDGFRGASSGWH